jgi:hypothetical protein
MITDLQPFRYGREWERGEHWMYVLTKDLRGRCTVPLPDVSFRDRDQREWMRFEDGDIIIREGYASDGCTCAPTTKKNIRGAFFHDAGYQFLKTAHMVLSKDQWDSIFYAAMRNDGFLLRGPYYHAVSKFGHLYLKDSPPVHSVLI